LRSREIFLLANKGLPVADGRYDGSTSLREQFSNELVQTARFRMFRFEPVSDDYPMAIRRLSPQARVL